MRRFARDRQSDAKANLYVFHTNLCVKIEASSFLKKGKVSNRNYWSGNWLFKHQKFEVISIYFLRCYLQEWYLCQVQAKYLWYLRELCLCLSTDFCYLQELCLCLSTGTLITATYRNYTSVKYRLLLLTGTLPLPKYRLLPLTGNSASA